MKDLREAVVIVQKYINENLDFNNPEFKEAILEYHNLASSVLDGEKGFWFKDSIENGEKVVWLCFKNGMINLNAIADSKPGIVGNNLKKAIASSLSAITVHHEKKMPSADDIINEVLNQPNFDVMFRHDKKLMKDIAQAILKYLKSKGVQG